MLHVVLYKPEIPPNTGNIARQCIGMHANLHIIGPIQFDLSQNSVRRAGLDYWDELNLSIHKNADTFLQWLGDREPWIVSKYGARRYDSADYRDADILLFGNELHGLPEEWRLRWKERAVHIPILGKIRSYNLANSVSVVLSHANLTAGNFEKDQIKKQIASHL